MNTCRTCRTYLSKHPHELCPRCWDNHASQAFVKLLAEHPLPYGTWLVDWVCADDPYVAVDVWEREVRQHPGYERLCEELGDEPSLLNLIDAYADSRDIDLIYSMRRLHDFLVQIGVAIVRVIYSRRQHDW